MKLTTFEIKFDNPQGVFDAGSCVSGQVVLCLAKPMKMRSLKLHFFGEGKSHWVQKRGKKKVNYRGQETYIHSFMTLFTSENQGSSSEHPAGNHAYPFSLQLLDILPSSFEGSRGHVRYYCKATIDRPWKFDSHVKRAFSLIHHLDLNKVPTAPIPIDARTSEDVEGCCTSAGTFYVELSLNKTGYVPGEPIVYDIRIDNQTDYRITDILLELVQTATYKGISDSFMSSGNPKLHPKTISFDLFRVMDSNIKQRTTETIRRANVIPSVPPSFLEGCDIIDIQYNVKLKVNCNGTKAKITKSIIVGTMPLREPTFQTPLAPSAPATDSPTAPITLQPQSINVQFNPEPVPPSYEEASAPPPSYSECVYGRTAIRDANDDDHTTGDVTWAPTYPYYDWSTMPNRGRHPEVSAAGPPQYGYDDDD
ncbi:Arrestin (or S-antigen) [Mactra antiquata]